MKNTKDSRLDSTSKQEQVLNEIFSNTNMEYLNEHLLELNFGNNSLLIYNDLLNSVEFDIQAISDEFRIRSIDQILTSDELAESIKRVMSKVFNIDNISSITSNSVL